MKPTSSRATGRAGAGAIALAILLAGTAASQPQPVVEQSKDTNSDSELLNFVQTRMFRFVVERGNGDLSRGSGVLIGIVKAQSPGELDVATFATVYHVVQGAKRLRILDYAGRQLAESTDKTECYAARNCDLAYVKLPLRPSRVAEYHVMPLEPQISFPVASVKPREKLTGMAFGFSREGALLIDYSRIEFLGKVTAGLLPGLVDQSSEPDADDLSPASLPLQLLTDEATLEGMSGGLVLDRHKRFGGLVFGRMTDRFNLIIPAEQVTGTWDKARSEGVRDRWKPLKDSSFERPSLFAGGQGDLGIAFVDKMDWGTVEGLSVLFQGDPSLAIGKFQEIVVEPPKTGPNAPDLELIVDWRETLPDDRSSIDFSLDGRRISWNKDQPERIPLAGRTGERLLIVSKASGRVNDFEIGGLLAASKINLIFKQDGRSFRRVIRSLPRIVQRYPIYVTIRNGSPLANPVLVDASRPPANARIAVRLDYVEALLRQAPLLLRVTHGPDDKGSLFDGVFELDRDKGWDINMISPQRLGLTMRGRAKINRARYQAFGLGLVLEDDPKKPLRPPMDLEVRGRLQFPADLGDFYVSARATGTAGIESFRLDLGNGLSLDASGLLRCLFTCYVNNRLLLPEDPKSPERDEIKGFLANMGLMAPRDWSLEPRQILIVPASNGLRWIVATMRLDRMAAPRSDLKPNLMSSGRGPELLSPPIEADGVVFDLTARDVPGILVARFPGLPSSNPLVAESLSSATIREVRLTTSPPPDLTGDTLHGESVEPIPLQDDNGRKLAERIRTVFGKSVRRGRSVLAITSGHDLARRALERALNRQGLALHSEGDGVLRLLADSDPKGSQVYLKTERGTCQFSTPKDQVIDLGGGNTLKNARLVVTQLDSSSRVDQDWIKARLAALLEIGTLKFGSIELQELSGDVTATLDTSTDKIASMTVDIRAGRALIAGRGPVALTPFKDFRVDVGRDLSFRFDQKQLMEILVQQVIGLP
jgi:hypothetical protein